jgi:hypothetical protein
VSDAGRPDRPGGHRQLDGRRHHLEDHTSTGL